VPKSGGAGVVFGMKHSTVKLYRGLVSEAVYEGVKERSDRVSVAEYVPVPDTNGERLCVASNDVESVVVGETDCETLALLVREEDPVVVILSVAETLRDDVFSSVNVIEALLESTTTEARTPTSVTKSKW